MFKHIVIKHEDLHPEIAGAVSEVIGWRAAKKMDLSLGAKVGAAIGAVPLFFGHLDGIPTKEKMPLAIATLLSATTTGTLIGYRLGQTRRDNAMAGVQNSIKANTHLDADKKHEIAKLRKTHPLFLVTHRGDVVLVPNTRVQRAFKKAGETFFKGLVRSRREI